MAMKKKDITKTSGKMLYALTLVYQKLQEKYLEEYSDLQKIVEVFVNNVTGEYRDNERKMFQAKVKCLDNCVYYDCYHTVKKKHYKELKAKYPQYKFKHEGTILFIYNITSVNIVTSFYNEMGIEYPTDK